MRQAEPLLRRASAKQKRTHGRGLADAGGGHGRGDVGHGVVDCETGGDGAAGGVDVEVYGLFGGVGLEEEELGDDGGGDGFVHCAVEADDAFLVFTSGVGCILSFGGGIPLGDGRRYRLEGIS